MMNIPEGYRPAIDELVRWAESVGLRLSLLESLVRQQLKISDEDWKQALIDVGQKVAPGYRPPSMSETAEALQIHFRNLTEV
jgi:hypothetical protein